MDTLNKSNQNYTQEIFIQTNQNQVYQALTNQIDEWWSTVDQSAKKAGDIFKISFGGESYWKFKVLEASQMGKVVWECIESNQNHNLEGTDEEWLGTELFWEFAEKDQGILLTFLHKGLLNSGICYEVCSNAWDFYITESLKNFLEKDAGKPNGR